MSTKEFVMDNTDIGFTANGGWKSSSKGDGFEGVDYVTACRGNTSATWRVGLSEAGFL